MLHVQVGGAVVVLQVSALSKHWVESRQEQAGCPVTIWQILSFSQGANVGSLALHSQEGGVVVVLHTSALSKHCVGSRQEQGGWSVTLWQTLSFSHVENVGVLVLHSHVGGDVVVLQKSPKPEQSEAVRQEHAGCPTMLWQTLSFSQVENVGAFELHSQEGGVVVALQKSALSPQSVELRQEHAG